MLHQASISPWTLFSYGFWCLIPSIYCSFPMVLSFPTTLPSADFASNWASQEELAQPFTLWYRRDALRYFRGHQLNVCCYICIRSFPSLITQSPVIRALNSHDKKTISIGGRSLQGWLSKTELWCQQIFIDHRVLLGIFARYKLLLNQVATWTLILIIDLFLWHVTYLGWGVILTKV